MRKRQFLLFVSVLVAVVTERSETSAGSSPSLPAATCRFSVRANVPSLVITGPEEIASRVRSVRQPDSPVAISRLDLSEATLSVGAGYDFQQHYSVDVVNLSDQTVSNVQLRIQIRHRDGGAGGGPMLKGPLKPGESGSVRTSGGRAHGTSSSSDDLRVLMAVESVEFSDCVYRPSQALPVSGKPLP